MNKKQVGFLNIFNTFYLTLLHNKTVNLNKFLRANRIAIQGDKIAKLTSVSFFFEKTAKFRHLCMYTSFQYIPIYYLLTIN